MYNVYMYVHVHTCQCSPQDFLKGYWGLHNQNFLGYVIHYYVIMMS